MNPASIQRLKKPVNAMRRYLCSALMLSMLVTPALAQGETHYLTGRGAADITGPPVGMQFWGFARADQIGEGIHLRQRSRAFVIAERARGQSRLALVTVDIGSIDHHIALEVIDRLQKRFGDQYTLANVLISATHTHSGPGGYWHSRTDTGLDGGFYPAHFNALVEGITASIAAAHEDLAPGDILLASGPVNDAGVNRSAVAYAANPATERARYIHNTNRRMTLLRFTRPDGSDIGMLSWYALHPTAMNYYNRLVSGDHKGYASLGAEKPRNAGSGAEFVAAFAQSDPGDVTPNKNLDNTGPGDTDVATTRIMGQRQLDAAEQLFGSAAKKLQGPVESLQTYVNLKGYRVADEFTGAGEQTTCPSAYGYSFAGGSTEDGGAHFLFEEGMTQQSWWLDWLIRLVTGAPRWTEEVRLCQAPKPILFETGTAQPPMQSQVHSIGIARIGQLALLAIPAEVTTMAGRRLREVASGQLGSWADTVVLGGYINGYSGYITTPEEYRLQQYEAAHTLHGQWTLPALQQIVSQLAQEMESGTQSELSARYDDWRGRATPLPLPGTESVGQSVQSDAARAPGKPIALSNSTLRPNDKVTATFHSVNPTAHYRTGVHYLLLEAAEPGSEGKWRLIATDSDWSTRVRWSEQRGSWVAELSWEIPAGTPPGRYRLVHQGNIEGGNTVFFRGESAPFEVTAR